MGWYLLAEIRGPFPGTCLFVIPACFKPKERSIHPRQTLDPASFQRRRQGHRRERLQYDESPMNRETLPFFSPAGSLRLLFVVLILLLACSPGRAACPASSPGALLDAMQASYARVKNYRTTVEVKEFREDGSFETKRFLYTFEKPDHIRIDLISPDRGMVLIYPDRQGKVLVFARGLFSFLKFHLSPGSSLLEDSTGQKINQTDMGLLIRNIAHSLTDQLRGEERITEEDGHILVSATAENHFIKGVTTRYRFVIDKKTCLPVRVDESNLNGTPERTIIFRNLALNTDVAGAFMQQGGGRR